MQVLLHPSDMPVFRLAVRAAQCRLEIRINDVPVFRDGSGLAQSFEMPVNEWLFQGRNAIRATVSPMEDGSGFGPSASLEIALEHKRAGEAMRTAVELGVLRWSPAPPKFHDHDHDHEESGADGMPLLAEDDDDAPLLALPGKADELTWRTGQPQTRKDKSVQILSLLTLPAPWQASPWSRVRPLLPENGTLVAVRQLVQTFWRGLKHGSFEPLLQHRRQALQASYYLRENYLDEALGFPGLLKTPGWQLQPLRDENLLLELAAGSRIARVTSQNGESPLWLLHEEDGLAAFIDCWWMFHQEWRMIR